MRHSLRSIAALSLLLAATACGGDDSGSNTPDATAGGPDAATLTQAQAVQAYSSTQTALTSLFGSIGGSSGNVNTSVNCPGGGTAAAQGTVSNQSFSLTVTMNQCVENSVAVSGSLSFNVTISGTTYNMHYTGNLTYGGGVQGSCPIDVTVTSSGSAATYHGTVCGISITSP